MNAKRGYVPEDERNFSPSVLETLRTASSFVGNHFLLSERQRFAIMRSLATEEQLEY